MRGDEDNEGRFCDFLVGCFYIGIFCFCVLWLFICYLFVVCFLIVKRKMRMLMRVSYVCNLLVLYGFYESEKCEEDKCLIRSEVLYRWYIVKWFFIWKF